MKQAPQVCCCKLGNILEIKPERVNGKLVVREAWGRKDYGPGSFEVKWLCGRLRVERTTILGVLR